MQKTRQTRIPDIKYNQEIIGYAAEIISNGSSAISKAVRAGFTTSAIMACEQDEKEVTINRAYNPNLKGHNESSILGSN